MNLKLLIVKRSCLIASALLLVCSAETAFSADNGSAKLPSDVVARQGGVDVTIEDLNAFAAKIPDKDRPGYFDSPKRIESTILSLLLDKQLAAAARADKLDRDPLVQKQIAAAVDDTLAHAQIDRHRKNMKLPDFDVLAKEYYDSHRDDFIGKGEVTVQHVLVSTKDRSEDEAKARIEKVEAAAKAHPEKFEALVDEYSDDPSKATNHGTIENAGGGKAARPFAAAANALTTPGQISPVTRTQFGFHVLKLIDRKPDDVKPFDKVKPELVAKLRTNFIDAEMNQYTGELRGQPLQADPDLVASLRTRYLPAGMQTPEEAAAAASAARTPAQSTEPAH